jgi:hypothetical protein
MEEATNPEEPGVTTFTIYLPNFFPLPVQRSIMMMTASMIHMPSNTR